MYTQCPNCGTAFRVTAEVLRQAAGKVRCGSCGFAFNALDYLSEIKPALSDTVESAESVNELKPDTASNDDGPQAISAERSAALLKTLDELAGDDVRIEDTGVEWRVLDEDGRDVVEEIDDTGSMKWFLDESPTPVDETLSDEPGEMDASEIFADGEREAHGDEMRFDDDTPLPDDFDFDAAPANPEPQIETRDAPSDFETAQVDLALGEPEDWEDLLGEVDEEGSDADSREMTLAEELEALPAEDGEPGPERKDEVEEIVEAAFEDPIPDVDKQFDTLAEAMGIDLSGMHARLDADEAELELEDPPDVEDTSIEEDLIAAAFETEAKAEQDKDPADEPSADVDEDIDEDVEIVVSEDDDSDVEAVGEESIEIVVAVEGEAEEEPTEIVDPDEDDIEVVGVDEADDEVAAMSDAENDEELETLEFDIELEEDADLVEARDHELVVATEADARLAAELGIGEPAAVEEQSEEPDKPEQVVEAMTEEELTVNMMIDEELLAIAVTDEEGFASTIVQKQDDSIAPEPLEAADEDIAEEAEEQSVSADEDDGSSDPESEPEAEDEHELVAEDTPEDDQLDTDDDPSAEIEQLAASGGAHVETIIMEGDFVRGLEEEEKLEEARRKTGDPNLKSAAAAEVTELKQEDETPPEPPMNWGLVGGIALLAVLLILQVLHQSREALAVNSVFNSTFGSVYRVLGSPITPNWNVSGWRFEKTPPAKQEQDSLTIYSQIGNKSDKPLPYPLINVSLTNRYQDVIGSKLLEPAEYLPDRLDTRELVEPGTNFAASFRIQMPDADIHGFKLDVCYRHSGRRLKCKEDDFK